MHILIKMEKASIHFLQLVRLHWRLDWTGVHLSFLEMMAVLHQKDDLDFSVPLTSIRSCCAVGGSRSPYKEPTQTQGEHAKHIQESNPLPSCRKATALTSALKKTRAVSERRGNCSRWFSCCCCFFAGAPKRLMLGRKHRVSQQQVRRLYWQEACLSLSLAPERRQCLVTPDWSTRTKRAARQPSCSVPSPALSF